MTPGDGTAGTTGLKIGIKLGILLAVFGILATGLTGYYSYSESRALLLQAAQRDLQTATQVLGRRLQIALDQAARDARLLAGHPTTIEVAGAPDGRHGAARREELARTFTALLGANPEYFQVRLIGAGEHGLERLRIDRDGDRLHRVPEDELQEKAHYPYVFETLRLPPGGIYLSSIAINHETGAHAGQEKPTLRVATPVAGANGRILGIVVVNIDVDGLFRLLQKDLPESYRVYLGNQHGDFLIHPDPALTFGFERGQRHRMQEAFPETAALFAGDAQGRVFVQQTEAGPAGNFVAAFQRLPFGQTAEERFVVLGLSQPLREVLSDTTQLGANIIRMVLAFSLLAIVIAALVSRAVTGPLDAIVRAARRFSREHAISRLPLERRDEIGVLARNFHAMQQQIVAHLAELNQSRAALDHMARHDPLTGLPNRRMFFDCLEHAIARARRDGRPLALLFIDLDRFKEINDGLGHALGDAVLQRVAALLRGMVREEDTVARLGGDEFVILFESVEDSADVERIARKLHERFQQLLRIGEHTLRVHASIGVSLFPRDGRDGAELLQNADMAMYRSKQGGRNTFSFHQPTDSTG